MTKCFDCGLSIDPDHVPRVASGQLFHPTASHCVSALLPKVAALKEALQWIADNTGRDTWLSQFERRFDHGDVDDLMAAIDAARRAGEGEKE